MNKDSKEQMMSNHVSDSEREHIEPPTTSLKTGIFYKPVFHLCLILLIAFIAYSNTFHAPFVFDDKSNIVKNLRIRNISNIPSMFTELKGPPISARPLTSATFAINYYLGGLNATGYHVFNLVLHIINGTLIYFLILMTARLMRYEENKKTRLIALFSSLLFIAHPIQTESVTYIVSRSVLLSTAFFLLGIILFVKAVTSEEKKALYLAGLTLTSLAGMASREEVFLFPFILLLYDFFFIAKFNVKTILSRYKTYIPVFLTLSYLLYIVLSYDYKEHAGFEVKAITPIEYLITQVNVHWTYLRLLILPINQNLDYDYPIARTLFEFPTGISFIGYTGLWIAGIILTKKNPIVSFCILWFMITLTPSSSVIPIRDVIFEHRLYVPLIGFSLLLSVSFFSAANHFKSRSPLIEKGIISALVLIIITLIGLTHARNIIWGDEFRLWEDVTRKSPSNPRAYHNLGLVYSDQNNLDKALEAYNKAIALNPRVSLPYNNRGNIYAEVGKYRMALEDFSTAISIQPMFAEAYYNRGFIYNKLAQHDKAIEDYTKAITVSHDYMEAYNNRGNAYDEKGLPDKALEDYNKALSIDPNFADAYYNRGVTYARLGRPNDAGSDFQKACRLGSKSGCQALKK